jgi:hypothetical protein
VRASLEELTAGNGTIVVGEVLDAYSYWNREGTFILTDVRIATTEVLKGTVVGGEITVTLLGGSVDDVTVRIVAGAWLVPGKAYVLFLNEENLPGLRKAQTVRDHCQGVFEIVDAADGLGRRAVSQAREHGLWPDARGQAEAPGGAEGLPLDALKDTVRKTAMPGAGARS